MSGPLQTSGTLTDRVVQRGLWLDSALDEMSRDLEEDRFVSAVGHFREALGLSRGLPQLKARVNEFAELHSEELLPRNWRVAEALLQEAAATEPPLKPDPELLEKVKQARHDERISIALNRVDRLTSEGKTAEAREQLAELLAVYPTETRIRQRLHALDHPGKAFENAAPPPASANVVDVQPLPVAEEPEPEPEAEPEAHASEFVPAFAQEQPNSWQTKVLISSSAWNAIKDLAAVVATAAMLGTAGFLVWKHYSEPSQRTRQTPSVQQPESLELAKPLPADAPQGQAGNSVFQDVPVPPSDQDTILRAVQDFSETSGRKIDNEVVDEVDIQGKQAKVHYRPKGKSSGPNLVFSLIRQSDGWKVQKVE
jgi:hypothetical protein